MKERLSFVAKAIRQDRLSPADFQATSAVLSALGGAHKNQVLQALEQAKEAGVNLAQVGGLALLSNRPMVAAVLAEHFGIKVVDYTSSGGEIGIDAEEGYPLLAYLAYMSKGDNEYTSLQKRALKWGADPQSTWTVSTLPPHLPERDEKNGPHTISWVSENIRSLNLEMIELLCEKIEAPPSTEEQTRRLLALRASAFRRTGEFYWEFREVADLFCPGGKFAIKMTPWDTEERGKSVAFSNTVALSRNNRHVGLGRALSELEPWIIQTAPERSDELMDIAIACIKGNTRFPRLPQWLVPRLDAPQAQAVLKVAWSEVFKEWIPDDFGGRAKGTINVNGQAGGLCAEHKLRENISFLDELTQIATREPCFNGAETPEFLLASVSSFALSRMSMDAATALAAVYPKFPGAPDTTLTLAPLREILGRKTSSSSVEEEMHRYHQACGLRTHANEKAFATKKKGQPTFATAHQKPRL